MDLLRFFFLLPEPLAVPSTTVIIDQVGNDPASFNPLIDDPLVWLRFHQRDGHGRLTGGGSELFHVAEQVMKLERVDDASDPPLLAPYTIAEAVTAAASPDALPDHWQPHLLTPRSDAFTRCLRLADDHVRAYRLATSSPYGRVTYERTPTPVLTYQATVPDGASLDPAASEWSGPGIMYLGHTNAADPVRGPVIEGTTAKVVDHWLYEIRHGSPLVRWRELLLDAQNAVRGRGDTALAAVLAQTASEVFLDSLLQLLMWEEGLDSIDASALFVEGKVVARTKREFAKRLGGAWVTDGDGPLAVWVRDSSRLRHRVVHGGYEPHHLESDAAIVSVLGLETFAFDRLVANRNSYPKTTLMTVAQDGLERRKLWGGQIKRFAEGKGATDSSWQTDFHAWRAALVRDQLGDDA